MRKIIIANWKALPPTLAEAHDIIEKIDEYIRELDTTSFDLVICPPLSFLGEVAKALPAGAILGAQDLESNVSELGARYVIVGHSDRRYTLGEDDATVNTKLKTVLQAGMTPVVCVGERTREGEWKDELASQVAATFDGLSAGQLDACLIAYEPVWAISTSPGARPDTPASAVQSLGLIREVLADHFNVSRNTFLYGGSVTAANAQDFLERAEVSGVLVGGASVRPEFMSILSTAHKLSR